MELGRHNHIEWTTPQLINRLSQLAIKLEMIPQDHERYADLDRESEVVTFELVSRNDEQGLTLF